MLIRQADLWDGTDFYLSFSKLSIIIIMCFVKLCVHAFRLYIKEVKTEPERNSTSS